MTTSTISHEQRGVDVQRRHGKHLAQFYEQESFLYETVGRFVAAGLGGGETVIIIATPERLDGFRKRLLESSFDVSRASEHGQLQLIDAIATLSQIVVDERVDAQRFSSVIRPLIERAARTGVNGMRAYGEMVDVLCQQGRHRSAAELEELWNVVLAEYPLTLLCGYSLASFPNAAHAESFLNICAAHSSVGPAEGFAALKTEDERLREVSLLQQRARALEAELERRNVTERALREREEQLHATAGRLEAVLRQMPSAVAIVEAPSGKLLLANEHIARIFGEAPVAQDEWKLPQGSQGRNANGEPLASEDWPLSRSIGTGEVVRGEELRIERADGTPRYVRVSSSPIRDATGQIIAGVATCEDITEQSEQRRITETLLRVSISLSTELDRDVLMQKLTDEATALCRAEFGSFFYNVVDSAGESYMLYTLSGVPREAFSRFPMPRNTAVFAPTFSGRAVVRIHDVKKDPRYGKNPPYNGMPEGHLPVASYLAVPVKTRGGEVLGGLFFGHSQPGVFSEADERLIVAISAQAAVALENARAYESLRAAEQKAQLERQRLHDLFMQAPAAICIFRGPEHVLEFANAAALALFPTRDVLGRPLAALLDERARSSAQVLEDVLRTGERQVQRETPAFVAPNSGRDGPFFDVTYEPLRDEGGAVVGVMTFGFDVTEQVLARRKVEAVVGELETANRMKDEFLATVSHELRTPLNAILGWVRMLRAGSLADDRREKALETIERNANAQTQLIEDLLDVSRIISGKLRLNVAVVDLPQVVTNAIEAVRPAASAKGVELSQRLQAPASAISGDADRLQQVVWNLLSNAVKFTPQGGHVHVDLETREAFVEIAVSDDGQGIDPEFLPYVFERFRQADATTARQHMGLGLGLAIVRHLVELHGGNVRVESEGLGRGARFLACLPVAPHRTGAVEQPPPLRQPAAGRGVSCPAELADVAVLVVEDDEDSRELLTDVLRPCGMRVSTASNVPEALSALEEATPDVIVSDIGLPGEDGYALIRKLRARAPAEGGKIPAIALTAYTRVEDRMKALAAGFNMHIAKPVEPGELLSALVSLAPLFAAARRRNP